MALGPATATPLPSPKRFAYANAGGGFPAPDMLPQGQGFPLYESAEVVGAPEVDEDHPDELSYVPFEVSSLMTDTSVAYNSAVAELAHPEQHDLSYLFEDMDHPFTARLRPASSNRGISAAQKFVGAAVRSLEADLAPPKPTQLAQTAR
jgi:hypothetical protein